ncbi:twin-arginine translocation signal domain-containing protein, partial [Streptomyces europaeiscabiei]|uniref:twin-arginine translocation signal domain-containing protein n=1 Tax=Streptomyces europaeiscabiei TaxID=146819 RepID=UPI003BA8BC2C
MFMPCAWCCCRGPVHHRITIIRPLSARHRPGVRMPSRRRFLAGTAAVGATGAAAGCVAHEGRKA